MSRFAGAPSVTYPVGRSWFYALALGAIALVAGVVLLLWLQISAPGSAIGWAAIGLWWLAVAVAAWHWRSSPVGELCWRGDEGEWHWLVQGGVTLPLNLPECTLDAQQYMLLCCAPVGRAWWQPRLWLWVEAGRAPGDWLALRRAAAAGPALRARAARVHAARAGARAVEAG